MKKKDEIKKMENLIIENFAKVYNRIKPVTENELKGHNVINIAIAKALNEKPEVEKLNTNDGNKLYYTVKSDDEYYRFTIEARTEVDEENGLQCILNMYFDEDVYKKEDGSNRELVELSDNPLKIDISFDTRYRIFFDDSYDITDKLSPEVLNNLKITITNFANGELEDFIDKEDDGNMSDRDFHRWANPNMR
jgi:hypothetical protein